MMLHTLCEGCCVRLGLASNQLDGFLQMGEICVLCKFYSFLPSLFCIYKQKACDGAQTV